MVVEARLYANDFEFRQLFANTKHGQSYRFRNKKNGEEGELSADPRQMGVRRHEVKSIVSQVRIIQIYTIPGLSRCGA